MTEAERLALCLKYPYPSADTRKEAATLLRQLQAENEALRVDAERYRWLRKHDGSLVYRDVLCHVEVPQGPCAPTLMCVYGKKLDAAIDAAIKGEPTC